MTPAGVVGARCRAEGGIRGWARAGWAAQQQRRRCGEMLSSRMTRLLTGRTEPLAFRLFGFNPLSPARAIGSMHAARKTATGI